jgi:hypothetical protein
LIVGLAEIILFYYDVQADKVWLAASGDFPIVACFSNGSFFVCADAGMAYCFS